MYIWSIQRLDNKDIAARLPDRNFRFSLLRCFKGKNLCGHNGKVVEIWPLLYYDNTDIDALVAELVSCKRGSRLL